MTIGVVIIGTLIWTYMQYKHQQKVNAQRISIMSLQKDMTITAMNNLGVVKKEEA